MTFNLETGFSKLLFLTVILSLVGASAFSFNDVLETDLANGDLHLKISLPDARNGYYRGTRFDWSGVITALEYKGHNYYGHWYTRVSPTVHDFTYDGQDIVGSPSNAVTGPVEEFQTNYSALGFDEAPVGGTFIKIGVGVLRKDSGTYDYAKQYEIVDAGKWSVQKHGDSIEFTHRLSDPSTGYAYIYRKTVRLIGGKPEMVLEHRLKNTGRKTIETAVFNHNFLTLDHQPPGPDFSITFPFQLRFLEAPEMGLAEIRGNEFVFRKALANRDVVFARFAGFGQSAKDNEIRIENRRIGTGMLIRGDHPLSALNFWSIRSVLSVEPFISMAIEPGKEFTWDITYHYYTLTPGAK